jgi:hypothetical protein
MLKVYGHKDDDRIPGFSGIDSCKYGTDVVFTILSWKIFPEHRIELAGTRCEKERVNFFLYRGNDKRHRENGA